MATFNQEFTTTGDTAPITVVHDAGVAIISDVMVSDGPNSPLMEKILPLSMTNTATTLTVTFSTDRTGLVRAVGNI